MDFVSPLLELFTCLSGCFTPCVARIRKLDSSLGSLDRATQELRDLRGDVERRVREEEQQPFRHRNNEVQGWLQRTEELVTKAAQIWQRGTQQLEHRCLCDRCPRNCLSSYSIAQEVEKLLAEVLKALEIGRFEAVSYELSCPLVQERSLESPVGLDSIFQEAWRWINDGNAGVLGLYGVGGVGKTTLLTKINNEFINQTDSSKLVIWVTVNKVATVEDVQGIIRNRVNLKDEDWDRKRKEEKSAMIYQFLRGYKQFVLLLDDLWGQLDLKQVGIPLNQGMNIVKIMFTTRSQEVCCQMGTQKRIEVTCLGPSEAKALFNANVGEITLNSDPEIQQHAEIIAKKCGGLPIALKTIGRAMSGKTDPEEWRRAIRVLGRSLSKIPSMSCDVYPVLRLSYDSLRDETMKQCFLYCALFPEGYDIPKNTLIKCWVEEGILHKCDDISEELDQGLDVIEALKSACLLEISDSFANSVKMHDVIRDMALWIAPREGRNWDKSRVEKVIIHLIRRHVQIVRAATLFRAVADAD